MAALEEEALTNPLDRTTNETLEKEILQVEEKTQIQEEIKEKEESPVREVLNDDVKVVQESVTDQTPEQLLVAGDTSSEKAAVSPLIEDIDKKQEESSVALPPANNTVSSEAIENEDHEDPGDKVSQKLLQYGLPGTTNLRYFATYILSYDYRTKSPIWVGEYISRSTFTKNNQKNKKKKYYEDKSIPEQFRAKPAVYEGRGYERGHLSAAANTRTEKEWKETFFLSNTIPQDSALNRGQWSLLEIYLRDQVMNKRVDELYVYAGPLYLPKKIKDKDTGKEKFVYQYEMLGPNPMLGVPVPTHLFKVFLTVKKSTIKNLTPKFTLTGFLIANRFLDPLQKLSQFVVPVEQIEALSGLLFFQELRKTHKNIPQLDIDLETARQKKNNNKANAET